MPSSLIPVGQFIDRTWEYYRQNLMDLLAISGWILVTAILNIVALALYPSATTLATGASLSGMEIFGTVLFFITSSVIAPAIGLWILCATARYMSGAKGKAAAKEGWNYFWPVVVVSVFVQLMMLAGLLIAFGPAFFFLILSWLFHSSSLLLLGNFLVMIGVFAATIIVLRWFGFYVLAPYAVLLDNVRGKPALSHARSLVQGRFWSMLVRYAIPKLFFILIGVILMAIAQYLVNILVSAAAGLNLDVQLRLISIASSVVPIILAALLNPLIVISDVLLYNNLKQR